MINRQGLLAASLLVCATSVAAAPPPIVAVFPIEERGTNLGADKLDRLAAYLAAQLAASGHLRIVPREQVKQRLRAQKLSSYKSCYDKSCQVTIGRELAAQKSIALQLLRIGSFCVLSASLFDLRQAATERGATARGGCSEDSIVESIERVAKQLVGSKPPRSAPAIVESDHVIDRRGGRATAPAAGDELQRLELLLRGQSFREAYDQLKTVPPEARGSRWSAVVEGAVNGYARQLKALDKCGEAFAVLEDALRDYAFLTKQAGYLATRRDIGVCALAKGKTHDPRAVVRSLERWDSSQELRYMLALNAAWDDDFVSVIYNNQARYRGDQRVLRFLAGKAIHMSERHKEFKMLTSLVGNWRIVERFRSELLKILQEWIVGIEKYETPSSPSSSALRTLTLLEQAGLVDGATRTRIYMRYFVVGGSREISERAIAYVSGLSRRQRHAMEKAILASNLRFWFNGYRDQQRFERKLLPLIPTLAKFARKDCRAYTLRKKDRVARVAPTACWRFFDARPKRKHR